MLFRVGKVQVKQSILESDIATSDLIEAFARYIRGDWGDAGVDSDVMNDLAIVDGRRIVAVYTAQTTNQSFCITTEHGVTMVGFPCDMPFAPRNENYESSSSW